VGTDRVVQVGLTNVRFIEGDAQTLDSIADGFDAAVGRLVLMYFPDPATALRRAAALVQPGGLVCFHECDLIYDWAAPMTPLWTQIRAWCMATIERGTMSPRMTPTRVCRAAWVFGAGTAASNSSPARTRRKGHWVGEWRFRKSQGFLAYLSR
jgi:ubiquinone/menaquinone biosynthesis C-methylase UbiE